MSINFRKIYKQLKEDMEDKKCSKRILKNAIWKVVGNELVEEFSRAARTCQNCGYYKENQEICGLCGEPPRFKGDVMFVVSSKLGETITVGEVSIVVMEAKGDKLKIVICAPKKMEISVHSMMEFEGNVKPKN